MSNFIPEGATKPSSIEKETFDNSISASKFVEIPSNLQMRVDYDSQTDGKPLYVGYNDRGIATSSATWILQKFTYDGSRQVTLRQIAYDSWDNRASATYA